MSKADRKIYERAILIVQRPLTPQEFDKLDDNEKPSVFYNMLTTFGEARMKTAGWDGRKIIGLRRKYQKPENQPQEVQQKGVIITGRHTGTEISEMILGIPSLVIKDRQYDLKIKILEK
jgi:hypothetical protein